MDGQGRRSVDPFSFDADPRDSETAWYVVPPSTVSSGAVGGLESVRATVVIWISRPAAHDAAGAAVALAGDLARLQHRLASLDPTDDGRANVGERITTVRPRGPEAVTVGRPRDHRIRLRGDSRGAVSRALRESSFVFSHRRRSCVWVRLGHSGIVPGRPTPAGLPTAGRDGSTTLRPDRDLRRGVPHPLDCHRHSIRRVGPTPGRRRVPPAAAGKRYTVQPLTLDVAGSETVGNLFGATAELQGVVATFASSDVRTIAEDNDVEVILVTTGGEFKCNLDDTRILRGYNPLDD